MPTQKTWQRAVHIFWEQFAYSLGEQQWAKRTVPQYWVHVLQLLIAASDHRGADKEAAATVVAPPPLLQAATSPAQENSRKGKVSALPLSLYFSFFPLFKGDIKDEDIPK